MNLKTESTPDKITCQLFGRLDTIVSQEIEPEIRKQKDPEKNLVFDFKEVEYISSTFLRICLEKFKEFGPDRFWIKSPKPDIKKVFKIAGLERLIKD